MSLKRVRLELARDHDHPNGSPQHGYDFVAPLDVDGHLMPGEWLETRARCRVKRFWHNQPDAIGYLVRRRGGSWAFDYDPDQTSDDEPGFKLDQHRFAAGEYVSFREHDGKTRTFVVKAVADLE